MLDIRFIRENQDKVKKAIKDKNINLNLDELLDLDAQRRDLLTELESLKATKNRFSRQIAELSANDKKAKLLEMKEVDAKQEKVKKKLDKIIENYQRLMWLVPNIPSPETPIGKDASDNVPWSYWSPSLGYVDPKDEAKVKEIPTKFDFPIKDHITLGKELDLIDTEAGVKTSGFRGYYLKNQAVLLQYGVVWHALKKMEAKGFTLMTAPVLVKEFALFGSGHLPFGARDIYRIANSGEKEPIYLAGTSEPSILAYYADKLIDEKDLPIKVCAVTPCYRSEVGSYGKDTRGIYRIHEFIKVEQVILCRADINEADKWLEEMREIAQEILQDLKLPHRVLNICTGDMGAGKYKMYDIETWMPSRNNYGETHSDSNLTDWQARRLNIKYKDRGGSSKFVFSLNNTVIASPRILIAILENYQQKDGSVVIPEVLRKYVGQDVIKCPEHKPSSNALAENLAKQNSPFPNPPAV